METCNCFVSKLSAEAQFTTRYGAHAFNCPVYRESGDPVDRRADGDFRRKWSSREFLGRAYPVKDDPDAISLTRDAYERGVW